MIWEIKMINILKKLFFQNSQISQETAEKQEQEQIKQKELQDKIEELEKVFHEEAIIYQQREYRETMLGSEEMSSLYYNHFQQYLLPKTERIFNHIIDHSKTISINNIWLFMSILDMIISYQKKENIEKNHAEWMDSQKDNITRNLTKLKEREKELNKREAEIIKIEAAQKILNSNLLEKIHNEGDKND